jgi:hypothetical protein
MGCSLSICGIYGGTPNGRQLEELRQQFSTLYEETFEIRIDPKSIKSVASTDNLLFKCLRVCIDNMSSDPTSNVKINPEFMCSICYNVVWDARICLPDCQKMFCASCVTACLIVNDKCPCCRKRKFKPERIMRIV